MVKVEGLSVTLGNKKIVDNISFSVGEGKILGIVGESGAGKSMSMLAIMGLLPDAATAAGKIFLTHGGDMVEINALSQRERKKYNGEAISMIFQEPLTSLNPTMRVGKQIEEMLIIHGKDDMRKRIRFGETRRRYAKLRREKVYEMLKMVDFDDPEKIYRMYPHNMSGGMRQRIMIAMALILRPSVMIADEPTASLDGETEEEIIKLILRLNKEEKISIIFVSHNLELIRRISDDAAVMKDGIIAESGNCTEIFENPSEAYTRSLLENMRENRKEKLPDINISGMDDNILEVKNLDLYYPYGRKGKERRYLKKGIDFSIRRGEILGLQGKSGCGKTTLANAILGFHLWYDGTIINRAGYRQMIFQDPFSSLNPVKTIEKILVEPLIVQKKYSKEDIAVMVSRAIKDVGLDETYLIRYPGQLSGGQRQRIGIARAIIGGSNFIPVSNETGSRACADMSSLIVADEPVSALDVTTQRRILELLLLLQKKYGLSILFISHDKAAMRMMCDRIIDF